MASKMSKKRSHLISDSNRCVAGYSSINVDGDEKAWLTCKNIQVPKGLQVVPAQKKAVGLAI